MRCFVTADEIRDVNAMHFTTWVNGEPRQDALVRELIFDIPTLIETISAGITLVPGDSSPPARQPAWGSASRRST